LVCVGPLTVVRINTLKWIVWIKKELVSGTYCNGPRTLPELFLIGVAVHAVEIVSLTISPTRRVQVHGYAAGRPDSIEQDKVVVGKEANLNEGRGSSGISKGLVSAISTILWPRLPVG